MCVSEHMCVCTEKKNLERYSWKCSLWLFLRSRSKDSFNFLLNVLQSPCMIPKFLKLSPLENKQTCTSTHIQQKHAAGYRRPKWEVVKTGDSSQLSPSWWWVRVGSSLSIRDAERNSRIRSTWPEPQQQLLQNSSRKGMNQKRKTIKIKTHFTVSLEQSQNCLILHDYF